MSDSSITPDSLYTYANNETRMMSALCDPAVIKCIMMYMCIMIIYKLIDGTPSNGDLAAEHAERGLDTDELCV